MKNAIQEYWETKTKDEVKFLQSPFTVDISFEHKLFMYTYVIGKELKQIDRSHGGSLNHRVGGLMHVTVQTCYAFQYITMHLSGYMNPPTEPDFLALKHGMGYLVNHPHETIVHSRKKIHKTDESPHQCYFKAGYAEIIKIGNTLTSFTYIVMQIMPEISLIDVKSHSQFISSMVPA